MVKISEVETHFLHRTRAFPYRNQYMKWNSGIANNHWNGASVTKVLKNKLTIETNLWVECREWRVGHVSRSVLLGPRFEFRLERAATQKKILHDFFYQTRQEN